MTTVTERPTTGTPSSPAATRNARPLRPLAAVGAVAVLAVALVALLPAGDPADPSAAGPFRRVELDPRDIAADCKAVGDLNGDGLVDVVVADDGGTPLQWYAAPDWTPTVIDARSVFSTDMEVADVDADGDQDVIVPDYADATVLWYANPLEGGGDWVRHQVGPGLAHDVEVGDVDVDGRLDVVARAHDGATVVHLQDAAGAWTARTLAAAPAGEGTALGDLDADGDLDIAEGGYWLETPADPRQQEWTRHDFATGWPSRVSAAVADVDGDGRPDIALAASESTGRLVWYESPAERGQQWVEHVVAASLDYVHRFEAADLDADGDLDFAAAEMAQSEQRRVVVLRNGGDGTTWTPTVLDRQGSHNLRVADLGGDGDLDLIGGNWDGPESPLVAWESLLADPLGRWERNVVDAARPETAVFVLSADLDGDGAENLIAGAWWYSNPEPGGDWERHAVGDGFGQVAVTTDADGDGDVDLVGTAGRGTEPNAELVYAENDGAGGFRIRVVAQAQGDFLQGAVAWREGAGEPLQIALSWHEGGGGTQVLTAPADPSRDAWHWELVSPTTQFNGIDAGDMDGDGDTDLLLGTRWLRQDPAGWTTETLSDRAGDPDRVLLRDVDADGRLDAIIGYEVISAPGDLAWYRQPADPGQPWQEHLIAELIGPMSVGAADLDGDADLDIVAGEHDLEHPERARIVALEQADDDAWVSHDIGVGDEHHDGAHLVDIDLDGDLDVASIGWSHERVLLYENTAGSW